LILTFIEKVPPPSGGLLRTNELRRRDRTLLLFFSGFSEEGWQLPIESLVRRDIESHCHASTE
jgi:hypothetical protein